MSLNKELDEKVRAAMRKVNTDVISDLRSIIAGTIGGTIGASYTGISASTAIGGTPHEHLNRGAFGLPSAGMATNGTCYTGQDVDVSAEELVASMERTMRYFKHLAEQELITRMKKRADTANTAGQHKLATDLLNCAVSMQHALDAAIKRDIDAATAAQQPTNEGEKNDPAK